MNIGPVSQAMALDRSNMATLDPAWYHAWCKECYNVKPAVEKVRTWAGHCCETTARAHAVHAGWVLCTLRIGFTTDTWWVITHDVTANVCQGI
jgi:hypothetical protein